MNNNKLNIPAGRTAVIFDTPYLYHATKKAHPGQRVDYAKVMALLDEEYGLEIVKALAVVADVRSDDNPGFDGFLGVLRYASIESIVVKSRQTFEEAEGQVPKSDCNMVLAVEAMSLAPRVDNIVLASGNGDFLPLVRKLKAIGLNVIILSYPDTTSKELLRSCTVNIEVDDLAMCSRRVD